MSHSIRRRCRVSSKFFCLCGLAVVCLTGRRGGASSSQESLAPLNRFPRMVQEYFVEQVRRVDADVDRRYAELKSREDAEAYVRTVREKIDSCFGPLPEKTPLNPRITGVVERDAYRIEKVIFESRPGLPGHGQSLRAQGPASSRCPAWSAPAATPTTARPPRPTSRFAQGLARMGYVVLIFDPLGQGERLQYPDEQLKSRIGVGVGEHLLRRQSAVPGRRVLRHLAGLGRHPRARLPAHPPGSRSAARRRHRQLRRRHDDHLAVRRRAALDHGRPELLRHHLPPQPGERAAGRHRAVPAAGPGPGPGPLRFPGRAGAQAGIILAKEKDFFDVRGSERGLRAAQAALQPAGRARRTSACSSGPTTTATRRRTARPCTAGSTAPPASPTPTTEPS